jgi:hypothetical protein
MRESQVVTNSKGAHSAPSAAYVPIDDRTWQATALTRGPWHPDHQHAGPPIALACRAIEQAAASHGLTHLARLTANLIRPVPIGRLSVDVTTDYAGRNAGHFAARLIADDKEVARFTALAQRESEVELPASLPGHPWPALEVAPERSTPRDFPVGRDQLGYGNLIETRIVRGEMFRGPCAVWFRLRHPLIEGETPSGYHRVPVAADSGNGVSAILDFRDYVFVNSDLTINLLRRPVGEWVGLDAKTYLDGNGGGLAESALFDEKGLIGRSTQSLSVRKRTT